jgi:hypothetical protein
MKAKIIGGLLLSGAFIIPVASHAAIYEYVNTNGNVAMVMATTPSQAIATAPNIAPTSGVLLMGDPSDPIDPATYDYVNTSGSLEAEVASSPAEALAEPTNRAPTSGVILQSDL